MNDLINSGKEKIAWVRSHMPVLGDIEQSLSDSRPLSGMRIAMSIHLEAKTARLALCLAKLGAEVHASGSNPLSTRDDICAALRADGLCVNARFDESPEEYTAHLQKTLSCRPHVILDDGGDLVALLSGENKEFASDLIGGCEETTTGIVRLRQLSACGRLPFPMIDVNGAVMKHFFDNRYGTGQSVTDAITRTTNLVIASRVVVVAGYGWCGKGAAMRMRGMGARVIVTEIDPAKAVEAVMDGYEVMPMDSAAEIGDIFITVTGCCDVITARHFSKMKEGAILTNAGHFDVEVNVRELDRIAVRKSKARDNIECFELENGRRVYVIGQGRLVNLAAGDGHPAEIMDLSFSLQLLCIKHLWEHGKSLTTALYDVPPEIDDMVARLKLKTLGVQIDKLTPKQKKYYLAK